MEKSEFQAVIKHLYLKGLAPKEIKAELDKVHDTSAPLFATVYNWGPCVCNNRLGARPVSQAEGERDLWLAEITFLKNLAYQRSRSPSVQPIGRAPRWLLPAHLQLGKWV